MGSNAAGRITGWPSWKSRQMEGQLPQTDRGSGTRAGVSTFLSDPTGYSTKRSLGTRMEVMMRTGSILTRSLGRR